MHPFHRTELLVGGQGFDLLGSKRVVVVGLGGVGSYAAEALVRSGIGRIDLVDFDRVCVTNLNRQLHATRKTVGKAKAELMGERAKAINPKAEVVVRRAFYSALDAHEILGLDDPPDYVLDCIDNMTSKIHLLTTCVEHNIPVISALGAGGRMDPTQIQVSDISKTKMDPFAKIVRGLLRKQGIESGVECVWTTEPPNDLDQEAQDSFKCICVDQDSRHSCEGRLQIQGSVAWMPSIFGLTMAGTVVNRILGRQLSTDKKPPKGPRMTAARKKLSNARKKELAESAPRAE